MAFPKSRILTTQKLIQMFKESDKKDKRFCFILGSGASVESGIPSGNILEYDWMNCLMGLEVDRGTPPMDADSTQELAANLLAEGEITHKFEEIKAAWNKAKSDKKNSMSSEYYFDLYKIRFHPDLQDGYRYLETLMERKEPSPGYRAMALLLTKTNRHNLVITTNFDNLVEDALFLHTELRPLVVGHESLAGYIQFNTRRPIIVKVHRGLMYDPFNSPETTNELKQEWRKALDYAMQTYTPVVVGYGGGDESLMAYLKETNFPNGIYWCYREASGEPNEDIKNFLTAKRGYLVKTGGFDALMYSIGESLYGDEVGIKKTRDYLESQCKLRTDTYSQKWTNLEKQADAKKAAESVKAAEKAAENKRAEESKLTYWDYFDRGTKAADEGRYDDAIREYSLAIDKDPTRTAAYVNRCKCYSNLGKYDLAMQDIDKAIEITTQQIDTHINQGDEFSELGQYDDAVRAYSEAIELDPDSVIAYRARALAYRALGKRTLAKTDEAKAAELEAAEKGSS